MTASRASRSSSRRCAGRIGINAAFYIGHCALRRYVMGDAAQEREATHDEVATMVGLVTRRWRRAPAGRTSRFISTATTSCRSSRARPRSRPRDAIYYFDQGGNLNAIRWNDWKLSFASSKGNIATGTREVTAWSLISNLRMDPYERGLEEGGEAMKFLAQNMWLIVPVQGKIKEFFSDFDQFPYQEGSSLNAGSINYGLLRQQAALKRLNELERLKPR